MKVVENMFKIGIPKDKTEFIIMEDMWVKKYKVIRGTRVRVLRKVSSSAHGWQNTWPQEMNDTVGLEYYVEAVCSVTNNGGRGISLSSGYAYPFFVLEVLN